MAQPPRNTAAPLVVSLTAGIKGPYMRLEQWSNQLASFAVVHRGRACVMLLGYIRCRSLFVLATTTLYRVSSDQFAGAVPERQRHLRCTESAGSPL